jgi:hypothetical protein
LIEGEMKNAVLAVLLALAGQSSPPSHDSAAPAALPAQHFRLTPAVLLGAWRDARVANGAPVRTPLEVIFTEGLRPSTVFGYFTFGDASTPAPLRRLGAVTADQLRFDFPDGRAMTLQLDDRGRRLLGRLTGSAGDTVLELSRVRRPAGTDEQAPASRRTE